MPTMNRFLHIRLTVFGCSQNELSRISGIAQSLISRWESGKRTPGLVNLAKLRAAALARGIAWDDRWFFEDAEVRLPITTIEAA
jgi:transcriptional regulator with XRE-family HTH domain